MSRIGDFERIMRHEQPEHLLLDLGGCPLSSMEGDTQDRLLELLGFPRPAPRRYLFGKVQRLEESLLRYLDIDTRSVGEILHPADSQFAMLSDDCFTDEWGVTRKFGGKYWDIVRHPLAGAETEDLKNYRFPNAASVDPRQIEAIAAEAKRLSDEGEYVICAEHPVYGVFELGCWLCGFEDFLVKLMVDPDFVRALFDRILDYQKKIIEIYYGAVGPYVHYTSSGDDFATQESLFLSPDCFRELVKPYLRERVAYTRRFTRARFLHHSCGNVFALIPDLIDCGVEILNPIQPCAPDMRPARLKAAFGDRIVFHGGCDTQELLPRGTPEGIEAGVRELIAAMNRGGGYVFAAAHNLQDDVPPENIVRMFQAARKYGG
jgi:uroporphyrinogen decarboxylase